MELDQLRYFLRVAERGNFTRAAEDLRVSQPALSRSIQKLEDELGQPVFERRTRSVALTEAGVLLQARAQQVLSILEDTRAEITDVSNAVFEQADAIMLSGETSVGQYPLKCIEIMDRIARRVERSGGANYADHAVMDSLAARIVKSATVMCEEVRAAALIVFTRTGNMARNAAWLRPDHTPIYAFTNTPTLLNQLTLNWGITPYLLTFNDDPARNFTAAMIRLKDEGKIKRGDHVVAVTEVNIGDRLIDTILMETCD